MEKINSTKLHHQEESGNPTPSKTKGTTKKPSWTELCDNYGYPIIYWQIYVIIHNLSHISMDCKLPINTHTPKQSTLFNHIGQSTIANKAKPNKWQVGSGGDTHLINNINFSISQFPPCANWYISSETHQENAPYGLQISKIASLQWTHGCSIPRPTAALGINLLTVFTVRPYILAPQDMHIPKIALVLKLSQFMSP